MNGTSFRLGFEIQIRIECVFPTRTLHKNILLNLHVRPQRGKGIMRLTISMILLRQSSLIASCARRRTRPSVKGSRPLTRDHENRDAPSARSSRTLHTCLRTMPAMPIDETVCRCRRRRRLLRHRYEAAAPLAQPRICLPVVAPMYVCVGWCRCMRCALPIHSRIQIRTCVSILARRCAIGKRKTRLPAIIESGLIKRRSWECIGLHE